ncbi:MAG: RNA polymerase sigma factor [Planctomycetota bacterium]
MSSEGALRSEGDRYLVAAIQGGDADAFRQLVERFAGRLRAYAARRLGGTGVDPDDALQETFLGLVQGIARLGEVRSLEAYLFRVLRNKISDLLQGRPEAHGLRRVPLASEGSSSGGRGYEPISPEGTPSAYARREESAESRARVLGDVLAEAIDALKAEKNFRDLKILELLFYAPRLSRDVAAAVGTSEATVSRVRAAAIEKLAKLAARHPEGSAAREFLEDQERACELLRSVWRDNLLSCLKRSTLGAYALGVLEPEWADYVAFHVEVAGCEACAANLEDIRTESTPEAAEARERVFRSSVGFLKKR